MTEQPEGPREELCRWFDTWAGRVRDRDFETARNLFHPEVVGFGTHMLIVEGLDHLETEQWRNVWPTIENFHFLTDQLRAGTSNDGLLAWAVVPWHSTGFTEEGEAFERPGRATVLFSRDHWDEPWRAIHTHISLAPGTPQRSFGNSN